MLTVTHDIKSPLSSIIGYIELLNNTQLEERQHYFLKNMKGTAEHILHLANNMLDFSKLESNKMEINTVPYNPGRLLQETTDSFLPLAAQKSLELKSDISNALNGLYLEGFHESSPNRSEYPIERHKIHPGRKGFFIRLYFPYKRRPVYHCNQRLRAGNDGRGTRTDI